MGENYLLPFGFTKRHREREETIAAHDSVPGRNNKDRKQKQIEKTNRGLRGKSPPPSNQKNEEKTLAIRVSRETRRLFLKVTI
jgi:hypothetical protein